MFAEPADGGSRLRRPTRQYWWCPIPRGYRLDRFHSNRASQCLRVIRDWRELVLVEVVLDAIPTSGLRGADSGHCLRSLVLHPELERRTCTRELNGHTGPDEIIPLESIRQQDGPLASLVNVSRVKKQSRGETMVKTGVSPSR
jgi:hypothetical protein